MATKKLANKLGLLQKCSYNSPLYSDGRSSSSKNLEQIFKYLLVLDFESTCWEDRKTSSAQEIIEFPVVLLELSTGKVISEFHQYVLPVEHPTLSSFCTSFTGITQSQVEDGVNLVAAIVLFTSWLKDLSEKYNFSLNSNSTGARAAFATWSDWDLGVCLHHECSRKQLKKPSCFNQWIDVRATYKKFYNRRPQGVLGSLRELGIRFIGKEHSGIVDSRNTATLISRMVQDGCIFDVTKTMESPRTTFKM